jgi:hypothetical protein
VSDEHLKCPSARPEMPEAVVLGVVREVDGWAFVHHLAEPLPVTPLLLALAGDAPAGQVFRFAADCAGDACTHFDGETCRLATKLVRASLDKTATLPPCRIRKDCRWYMQEGNAACFVCPLILSETATPSADLAQAADPAYS